MATTADLAEGIAVSVPRRILGTKESQWGKVFPPDINPGPSFLRVKMFPFVSGEDDPGRAFAISPKNLAAIEETIKNVGKMKFHPLDSDSALVNIKIVPCD